MARGQGSRSAQLYFCPEAKKETVGAVALRFTLYHGTLLRTAEIQLAEKTKVLTVSAASHDAMGAEGRAAVAAVTAAAILPTGFLQSTDCGFSTYGRDSQRFVFASIFP